MKQYIIIPLFYFLSLIFLLFSLKMGIRLPLLPSVWSPCKHCCTLGMASL